MPFGVVGIIYEARPNVTADAGGICLKSGNAALLRGSSSAAESNGAVVEALQAGLIEAGLPADAIQLVPGPREVTNELMAARGFYQRWADMLSCETWTELDEAAKAREGVRQ